MKLRGYSAWSIPNGPFAAGEANFVPQIFQDFYFHTAGLILITPERGTLKKGKGNHTTIDKTKGYCLGHSK